MVPSFLAGSTGDLRGLPADPGRFLYLLEDEAGYLGHMPWVCPTSARARWLAVTCPTLGTSEMSLRWSRISRRHDPLCDLHIWCMWLSCGPTVQPEAPSGLWAFTLQLDLTEKIG